jgi:hypothetical protein
MLWIQPPPQGRLDEMTLHVLLEVEVRRFSVISTSQKTLQLVVGDDNATVVLILKRVGANVGVD